MKKKMLLGLFVVIPFLTACGSSGGSSTSGGNTMRCEYATSSEITGYVFKFDGDKLSGMGLFEGIDLNKLTDEDPCSDKASCIKLAESSTSECEKDSDMENCRVESDDDSVYIIGDYSEDALKAEKDYEKGMSKSEVKKQAESEGLTCR